MKYLWPTIITLFFLFIGFVIVDTVAYRTIYNDGVVIEKHLTPPTGGLFGNPEHRYLIVDCSVHGVETLHVTVGWYKTAKIGDEVDVKHRVGRFTGWKV